MLNSAPSLFFTGRVFFLAAGLLLAAGRFSTAQQEPAGPVAWKTGSEFHKELAASVGVTWAEMPLRRGLESLGRKNRVAIFLDRRVDPDQTLDLTLGPAPLDAIFLAVAEHAGIGVCYVGPVAYFGPPDITGKLGTLVELRGEELKRLPAEVRDRLGAVRPSNWPILSTPRELVEQLGREYQVQIVGVENMPHDLWPAGSLPPMGFVERLSILLAGFNVTFQFNDDGSTVRIAAAPDQAAVTRTYRPGAAARQLAERLPEMIPEAQIKLEGEKLIVTGSVEAHRMVEAAIAGRPLRRTPAQAAGPADLDKRQFSLTLRNQPVGPVIRELARQLGLEVSFDPAIPQEQLERMISFEVDKAKIDQLLEAALKPAGLTHRLEGTKLTILPRQP